MKPLRVLIGCETSGMIREAFRALGHNAWSCDLSPAKHPSPHHIISDVRSHLRDKWDLAILHPPCTRLCNSGVRWLHEPPPGKTKQQIWDGLLEAAELYSECLASPIHFKCIENSVMHKYATELIHNFRPPTQIIQPHWFGEKAFKATGLVLFNLPPLLPTEPLIPPAPGSLEHAEWSRVIHNASESENRAELRARTFPGIAWAMAIQWSKHIAKHLPI